MKLEMTRRQQLGVYLYLPCKHVRTSGGLRIGAGPHVTTFVKVLNVDLGCACCVVGALCKDSDRVAGSIGSGEVGTLRDGDGETIRYC